MLIAACNSLVRTTSENKQCISIQQCHYISMQTDMHVLTGLTKRIDRNLSLGNINGQRLCHLQTHATQNVLNILI
jgi:hypothetical protein